MTDDPLVMYYVLRKDVPLSLEQAMALAGAGAVRCVARFGDDPCFAEWHERARKVALRATADELAEIERTHRGVRVDDVLLCLVPLRKSQRSDLLAALRPVSDAPRPSEPAPAPPDGVPVLTYVVRPGVLRSAGKAMAQAGHAALLCSEEWEDAFPGAFAAWHAAGEPGRLLEVRDPGEWEALKRLPGASVVADAGLTQVAPGTETVIGVAPGVDVPGPDDEESPGPVGP